jgi:hypothetical protein
MNNINPNNFMFNDVPNNIDLPDEQKLINKLLSFYDPAARPVFNASQAVVINFSFALIQLCDLVYLTFFYN